MKRWFRRHRGWAAVLAFGLLFLVAFVVYRTLFSAGSAQEVRYVTQAVEKGTVIVSVSGTGNAQVGQVYDVVPSVSGVVRGLSVEVGDSVTEGQVLFTLESEQLDMNVISAQAAYDQARASLLNAEASVIQAEQSLEQLEDAAESGGDSSTVQTTAPPNSTSSSTSTSVYPSTSTTSTTDPPVNTSSTTFPPTTEPPPTTTTVTMSPPTSAPVAAQSVALVSVQGAGDAAATTLIALAASEPVDVSSSDTGSVAAQSVSTPTAADIEVAEKKLAAAQASLSASQANLQTAEHNLEQAQADAAARTVEAPTNGVITELNVVEGGTIGSTSSSSTAARAATTAAETTASSSTSSGTALTIADPRSISVVVQLMETDVAQIEVGQKTTLSFDALPDLTLAGKVTAVDLIGTVNQGVVTYNVTVVPDSRDDRVRAGMTSYASIVTAVGQDVLLVPSSAVKTATGGGSYVEVMVNGAIQQRTVTAGLSSDTSVEIASGLQEGEEVVTQTINPNSTQTQSQTNGFGLGGGGVRIPGAGGFPGGGR
ncbi:MAG: HlyD family efflux transporter periplasmic adaptor subunit [Thermoleophilia bacterium]|nr:HlyD family efflux transporter periplasmic adaptor subunit [Thermoleophilia bacterium]